MLFFFFVFFFFVVVVVFFFCLFVLFFVFCCFYLFIFFFFFLFVFRRGCISWQTGMLVCINRITCEPTHIFKLFILTCFSPRPIKAKCITVVKFQVYHMEYKWWQTGMLYHMPTNSCLKDGSKSGTMLKMYGRGSVTSAIRRLKLINLVAVSFHLLLMKQRLHLSCRKK